MQPSADFDKLSNSIATSYAPIAIMIYPAYTSSCNPMLLTVAESSSFGWIHYLSVQMMKMYYGIGFLCD